MQKKWLKSVRQSNEIIYWDGWRIAVRGFLQRLYATGETLMQRWWPALLFDLINSQFHIFSVFFAIIVKCLDFFFWKE